MSDFQDSGREDEGKATAVAHTVQDKAGESASLVGGKAAEVGGTAKEQAANVVGEATTQVRDLVGELRTQLTGQAESQTQRLAENVRRLSQELRELGENGKPDSTMAGVARQIADSGHQVAAHMEKRGPDGLVSDLQNFARRRPGVFLAGAALAGFVVARAGKGVSAAASSDAGSHASGDRGTTAEAGMTAEAGRRAEVGETGYAGLPTSDLSGIPAGYEDPRDTYGPSQTPHATPAPPPYPPASPPPYGGSPQRSGEGI
ncbi:hypothetical protein ACIGQE_27690 [Streptomyces sp. NPDC053429]|uniref:hypothetical protein n=1 Tax=Streptomyces sp. NPDC053429 TaxID=3365702 RepID=UPI0037D6138E